MSHRSRHGFRSLLFWCAVLAGCTKLKDPNQFFGIPVNAGGGGGDPGAAGQGGNGGALSSGGGGAGGTAGNSAAAGGLASSDGGSAGESGAASCQDSTGFHGLGCYTCAVTDIQGLENACTTASCTRFDDALRLTRLGANETLPPLPGPISSRGGGGSAGAGGAAGGAGGISGATAAGGAGGNAGSSGSSGKACSDLSAHGRVVYITGSSAAKPFLQQIAQQIAGQGIYLVYASTGSCVGVDAILNGTPITTGPNAAAASATYWDSSSSAGQACDLPAPGVPADIGASDVFAQSCTGYELSDLDALQIRDAHGPIQTMTFVVPANSTYSEISAQAAYFVFGFGQNGGVRDASGGDVWSREDLLFQRSASSGTQAMLAAAIGVPAAVWKGKPHKTSDDVAADIEAAGQKQDTANQGLGILAADYIDSKNLRAQIRVLAFQDSAQRCAMFPDSTSNAHDKRNVRDGHYPVWGPLHLLLKVDHSGAPINVANRQAIADIVGYLSGTKALPNGVQLLDVYAQSGLVPECAMHVSRAKDGGDILPFAPPNPCSCLFDVKATGATSCTACKVQGDCASGQTCSLGYCEG